MLENINLFAVQKVTPTSVSTRDVQSGCDGRGFFQLEEAMATTSQSAKFLNTGTCTCWPKPAPITAIFNIFTGKPMVFAPVVMTKARIGRKNGREKTAKSMIIDRQENPHGREAMY